MKSDKSKLEQFVLGLSPADIKQIFKSDLEADPMLNIFKVFLQIENLDKEKTIEIVSALQSVKPFALACEFLMDDEKEVIQKLMAKLGHPQEIKSKFEKAGAI